MRNSARENMALDAVNQAEKFEGDLLLDDRSDCTFRANDSFIEVKSWEFGVSWRVLDCIADDCGVFVRRISDEDMTIKDIHEIAADFMTMQGFLRFNGDIEQVQIMHSELKWDKLNKKALNHELDYLAEGKME